jgi:hypothetical protein
MALVDEFIAREDADGRWHGAFYGLHLMPGDARPRTGQAPGEAPPEDVAG